MKSAKSVGVSVNAKGRVTIGNPAPRPGDRSKAEPASKSARQQGKVAAKAAPVGKERAAFAAGAKAASPKPPPLVTSWTLKRSGAAMTLTGLVDGGPIIQGGLVRAYLAGSGEIVATHDDGRTWRLSKS